MDNIKQDKDLIIKRKCLVCEKDYDSNYHHRFTANISEYCKYLGCCSEECYYILDHDTKNKLFLQGFFSSLKK